MTAERVSDPLGALLAPEAVRERCRELFEIGLDGGLPGFAVDLEALGPVVDLVVDEIRRNYPSGRVPFHSRWRHFELGGRDLWADLVAKERVQSAAVAAARIDLAVVSVLLDAGAGPDWRYRDEVSGLELGRSEGLALASLRLFESGLLSDRGGTDPLRADAQALSSLTPAALAMAFQAGPDNPLVGVEERAGLLNRLGTALSARPDVFGIHRKPRPGGLFGHFDRSSGGGSVRARQILVLLLETLGEIWPSGLRIDGRALGDVGRHPALRRSDGTDGLVPFHKLSQWMSYSLIEPIRDGGIEVTELDGLTGLAEYRNGGLFLDGGVLRLRDPADATRSHRPTDPLIVEWRALTVALLDRTAELVREQLGVGAVRLPLASVLQGGTWSAGRRLARERRADGGPPLALASDGTVF